MLGFAVVDNQPGGDNVAVWLTSRVGLERAEHTNAVVIDLADADAQKKLHALIADRSVVMTDGSVDKGMPMKGSLLGIQAVDEMVKETVAQQKRIVEAVDEYTSRTKNKSLVQPVFPPAPRRKDFQPEVDTASQRAFQAANYLARAWTFWLSTDEQRRRRSIQPRTKETPWIMPDDMSSPDVAMFPPDFAQHVRAQPI
jgi:hypothetical protein